MSRWEAVPNWDGLSYTCACIFFSEGTRWDVWKRRVECGAQVGCALGMGYTYTTLHHTREGFSTSALWTGLVTEARFLHTSIPRVLRAWWKVTKPYIESVEVDTLGVMSSPKAVRRPNIHLMMFAFIFIANVFRNEPLEKPSLATRMTIHENTSGRNVRVGHFIRFH